MHARHSDKQKSTIVNERQNRLISQGYIFWGWLGKSKKHPLILKTINMHTRIWITIGRTNITYMYASWSHPHTRINTTINKRILNIAPPSTHEHIHKAWFVHIHIFLYPYAHDRSGAREANITDDVLMYILIFRNLSWMRVCFYFLCIASNTN